MPHNFKVTFFIILTLGMIADFYYFFLKSNSVMFLFGLDYSYFLYTCVVG